MYAQRLQHLRRAIDALDAQLLRLLNRRLRIARQIGAVKRARGDHWADPQRERAILRRLTSRNRGPLTAAALRRMYRSIFAQTRALQRSMQRSRR